MEALESMLVIASSDAFARWQQDLEWDPWQQPASMSRLAFTVCMAIL
jgi:hypothetical protein